MHSAVTRKFETATVPLSPAHLLYFLSALCSLLFPTLQSLQGSTTPHHSTQNASTSQEAPGSVHYRSQSEESGAPYCFLLSTFLWFSSSLWFSDMGFVWFCFGFVTMKCLFGASCLTSVASMLLPCWPSLIVSCSYTCFGFLSVKRR